MTADEAMLEHIRKLVDLLVDKYGMENGFEHRNAVDAIEGLEKEINRLTIVPKNM